MNRIRFIQAGGKELLFLDFSGCTAGVLMSAIGEAEKIIRTHPENSLLILTDVTNARFDEHVSARMKEFTKRNKPYVKASAVVGISGIKKIILDAVMLFSGRKIHACDTVEQAKEWLTTSV